MRHHHPPPLPPELNVSWTCAHANRQPCIPRHSPIHPMSSSRPTHTLLSPTTRRSRGTFAAASEVMRTSGVRGFWLGTGPSVIRVGLGVGLNMVLLENTKHMLTQRAAAEGGSATQLSAVGAAFAGGGCQGREGGGSGWAFDRAGWLPMAWGACLGEGGLASVSGQGPTPGHGCQKQARTCFCAGQKPGMIGVLYLTCQQLLLYCKCVSGSAVSNTTGGLLCTDTGSTHKCCVIFCVDAGDEVVTLQLQALYVP